MLPRLITMLLVMLTCRCAVSEELNLTSQERAFIEREPLVTIGGGESFEPFIFRNGNGDITGFDRDLADLIELKTGLTIKFELGMWHQIQQRAEQRELDGLSSIMISPERDELYDFSMAYMTYTAIAIVNRDNHKHIYHQEDVKHKRVAIQKGNFGFEHLARSLNDVEIVYYDDIYSVLDAVVSNEVDFTILDESIYYLADKLAISEFITTSFLLDQENSLRFALSSEKPLLASIFNKALASIGPYQLAELKQHWLKTVDRKDLHFSASEKDYLYQKKQLAICIIPDWYPYEKNEEGEHVGISAAYFGLFQEQLKIPIKLIQTASWSESLAAVKRGDCELLPLAMKTERRADYLRFTQPYLSPPLVIATQEHVPFIQSFDSVKQQSMGIVKNMAFDEIIRQQYPDVHLLQVDSIQEGLRKVEQGELFGFIDSLASISHQLQKNPLRGVKVSGRFDEKWQLSVAVRKEDPLLASIFEKLVGSITAEQHQQIINQYISVSYGERLDRSLLYQIGSVFIILLVLILIWNKRIRTEKCALNLLYEELKQKDIKLEQANKQLEQISITDKLTNIYNRRKIDQSLEDERARSLRSGGAFSIILFDIDHFKYINDSFGHQVGDQFLYELACLIKDHIRNIDLVGRWGGEEFMVISPSSTAEQAEMSAERLRSLVDKHSFVCVGHRTASFGVTCFHPNDDVSALLKRVDKALYHAKNSGRNQVAFIGLNESSLD